MTEPQPTPAIIQTGRRLLGRYMLDRAVVLDKVTVRTSGGTTTTFQARPGDPLPCRFGSVTDKEATQAAGLVEGRAASAVSFGVEAPAIPEGSKVRNATTGRDWIVVGNLTPESVMAVQARYLIREA